MAKGKAQKEFKLEEAMSELDALIEQLSDEELSLEASFQAYQKGMALVSQCNSALDTVEKQVLILEEGGEIGELQ